MALASIPGLSVVPGTDYFFGGAALDWLAAQVEQTLLESELR